MNSFEFKTSLKLLVARNALEGVNEILLSSLAEHGSYNDVVLICSQINDHLKKSRLGIVEKEQLRVKDNELKYRIIQFVDSLQFPSGWALNQSDEVTLANKYGLNSSSSFIPEDLKYFCNRNQNIHLFYESFNKNEKIKFYTIHGEERESPFGFYRRISSKEIIFFHKEVQSLLPIHIKALGNNLEYNKIYILKELFTKLQVPLPNSNIAQLKLDELIGSPMVQVNKTIVVGFKHYVTEWSSVTLRLIRWFVDDFCDVSLDDESVNFVFCLQLIYPNVSGFFKTQSQLRINKKIKNKLSFVPKIQWFNELRAVRREDVNIWLDYITEDPGEKEKLLSNHFPKSGKYHMSEVEKKLKTIINESNSTKSI